MKKVKNKLIHYKENKLFEWIIPSIALSTVIGVIMFMITLDAEYNFEQIFMKILSVLLLILFLITINLYSQEVKDKKAEELAKKSQTISYEITCGINRRVIRKYVGSE